MNNTAVTKYPEINELLAFAADRIASIFADKLVGLYLFGSLTYGDFILKRSDVDLEAVIKERASTDEVAQIKTLYDDLNSKFPAWKGRVECSFTPQYMLAEVSPPTEPRPYFGERFYVEATYGNEWLINNYLLQKYGIALLGPDFNTLLRPIDMNDIQKACKNDLLTEWEPKLNDPEYLNNPHNQSYFVLNLCRILYTIKNAKLGSKVVSASWVKQAYPQWIELIDTAEQWNYGNEMNMKDSATAFLKFVIGLQKRSEV